MFAEMGSQASDDSSSYSADFIAKSFVERYYTIVHSAPQHAHHFYQDSSVFGRPGPDGIITSVTTMQVSSSEKNHIIHSQCCFGYMVD